MSVMPSAAEVAEFRAMAEARMLDTCDIKYKTGETEQDPVTGEVVPIYATRFSTKSRTVVRKGLATRSSEVGGRTAVVIEREHHIPVGSPKVYPGDVAVMTSVHETSDPTLAGVTLILDGPAPGSQTTARRLQVSEVIA